jgi:RNA polymerase sigma-70 factor (ECF subfamily)
MDGVVEVGSPSVSGADGRAGQDDAALVAACRGGRPDAVERLVERFQADVFGTVLRLVHERDTALELTNSIFFKALQHLDGYDPERALRPWLLRIATNEALNWIRSRRREREHVLSGEASAMAFDHLAGGADPEALALQTEQRDAVRAALARLSDHYRLILILRFFNDLSYAEIAAHTRQDANTVGVQLLRARKLLKQALLEARDGPVTRAPPAPGQPKQRHLP